MYLFNKRHGFGFFFVSYFSFLPPYYRNNHFVFKKIENDQSEELISMHYKFGIPLNFYLSNWILNQFPKILLLSVASIRRKWLKQLILKNAGSLNKFTRIIDNSIHFKTNHQDISITSSYVVYISYNFYFYMQCTFENNFFTVRCLSQIKSLK